jgi:hypothetical protein
MKAETEAAFRSGEFPALTLSHGTVTVHGRQPFVLVDENRQLFVLDTTGRYSAATLVNSDRYDTAMVLTQT